MRMAGFSRSDYPLARSRRSGFGSVNSINPRRPNGWKSGAKASSHTPRVLLATRLSIQSYRREQITLGQGLSREFLELRIDPPSPSPILCRACGSGPQDLKAGSPSARTPRRKQSGSVLMLPAATGSRPNLGSDNRRCR